MRQIELEVPTGENPERVDAWLAKRVEGETRSSIQRLIDSGLVTVNGASCKASLKLEGGENVVVSVPPPVPSAALPEEIPLRVLHEDSDVIVIDKEAGMVVHQGAGNFSGTLVNALLAHCGDLSGVGGEVRPGIVHRLDKGTSGVLVVAKNDRAHNSLALQFHDHSVKRIYTAIVFGSPREDTGRIESPISRHPVDRKRMTGKTGKGKRAATRYRVLARYGDVTVVELRLETGRTHQIRVHLSEAGHPLLGDDTYGGEGRLSGIRDTRLVRLVRDLGRQALHAGVLGFTHPATGVFMEFRSELPEDMRAILAHLEARNNRQENS